MYFHVRIDYLDSKLKCNQTIIETDFSEKEKIISEILVNYLSGQRLYCDGTLLDANSIRQVHVYSTEQDIETERQGANATISPGMFYSYTIEDLLSSKEFSKDITREIIDEAKIRLGNVNFSIVTQYKKPLVFISHSSDDYDFVQSLTDMLLHIGLTSEMLFCSSIPGLWIGLSEDIFESLKKLFQEHPKFKLQVQH